MITKRCKYCNTKFQVKAYRSDTAIYCSNLCRRKDKKAALITMHCPTCDKSFSREAWKQRHSHKGQYCSQECYQTRSPQQIVRCKCGSTFSAHQSRLSYYSQVYCSRECYMKFGFKGRLTDHEIELDQYEIFSRSLRSTADYLRWAQKCKKRDYNMCQECSNKQDLTVHHKRAVISFIGEHGFNKEKIEQDPLWLDTNNGITLCRSCHLKQHKEM